MALINCPECKTKVSDKAESCPKCAYPIAGFSKTNAHTGKVQTIEKTSKHLKLSLILALAVMIAGFIMMIHTDDDGLNPAGFLVCFIGTLWFCLIKTFQWWRHG